MTARSRLLAITSALLVAAGVGHSSAAPAGDRAVAAAIARSVRAAGYEVTNRRPGHDGEVSSLEERDAAAYGPSTRAVFRLRSLRPWGGSPSTYFRYWLARDL